MGKDSKNELVLVQKNLSESVMGYYGNVLIGSSRDFKITEERYLMLLVAKASEQLAKYKKVWGNQFKPDEAICPKYIYFSPKVLLQEGCKKYKEVREAAENFAKKIITAETKDVKGRKVTRIVHLAGPIDIVTDDIGSSFIKLRIEEELWELILDMSKGFSYLDIRYLFRLSKAESMRLLPMFYNSSIFKHPDGMSGQFDLTYNLNTLKHMFGLDNSYKTKDGADDYANFVKKVIEPALDEIRNSGCPFYADFELLQGEKEEGKKGPAPKNRIRFIPRKNLTIHQSYYACLLPGNSPIRSGKVIQLLEQKYHFGKEIPKQVENVVCFAQRFISNDEDLWNLLYDVYPYTRSYDKGVEAGLIDQVKRYMKKHYDVEYVAPSKLKAEKKRIAKDGRQYTDWELVSILDPDMELLPADVERLKALTEAQETLGKTEFQNVVDLADKLQEEQIQTKDTDVRLVYGIEHLTDEQIFENVVAGVIDDKNVEKYDEDSYKRLNFIVGLMFNRDREKYPDFTWESVKEQMDANYYHRSPTLPVPDEEYEWFNTAELLDKIWDGSLPADYLEKAPDWYKKDFSDIIGIAYTIKAKDEYRDSSAFYEAVIKEKYEGGLDYSGKDGEDAVKSLFDDLSN